VTIRKATRAITIFFFISIIVVLFKRLLKTWIFSNIGGKGTIFFAKSQDKNNKNNDGYANRFNDFHRKPFSFPCLSNQRDRSL
jgi:hypothetical protein